MPVFIKNESTKPISISALHNDAENLLKICRRTDRELSILLIDDQRMTELNSQYRNRNKPTNVLSFPLSDDSNDNLLGDIVISLDTARQEAQLKNITMHKRLQTLLVHGLVHLLGYDHERSVQEALDMEKKERKLLAQLARRKSMIQLAINVDHVATLRQARGIDEPDPVLAAGICELAGAAGIVAHLREDRRHMQDRDIILLRQTVKTKLNLEMGADEEIIKIALDLKPDMVTLVPEKRKELTTEGGLDVAGQKKKLSEVIIRMTETGIPVSLFIDPDSSQIQAAKEINATFVEIHTGRYADALSEEEADREFTLIAESAEEAFESGLRVNAGHGLNYRNSARVAALGTIEELSIGHAVMARAIMVGLDQAVREMKALLPS